MVELMRNKIRLTDILSKMDTDKLLYKRRVDALTWKAKFYENQIVDFNSICKNFNFKANK